MDYKYAIKMPSYTKNYKLNGHLFQVYKILEATEYPNPQPKDMLISFKTSGYTDYERKEKYIEKFETFLGVIDTAPNLEKIRIHPWSGSSPMVVFNNLEDALVYKALANEEAKKLIFKNLEKIKLAVDKQTKKISIGSDKIRDKYPEYFLWV